MARNLRGLAAGLSVAALVALSGCESVTFFRVLITDFGPGQGEVAGLWLWQEDPGTGDFVRTRQLVFESVEERADGEFLFYRITGLGHGWSSMIERSAHDPAAVTLELALVRDGGPGVWRATVYNGFGESELSAEEIAY